MELYFFKQDALDYFRENISHNINNYKLPTNDWIFDQFSDPFIKYKDIDDFKLCVDIEHPNKMDLENSKRIYSNLIDISDSVAMDERLWAGLTHSVFYNYVQDRWSSPKEEKHMKKESYILTRYFFGNNSPKFRNTLCKLWWIGKLTYDDTNIQNPFHLTDVLGHRDMATRVNDLFTSNFSRNINVVKAFLETVDKYDKLGNKINADIYRSTVQYINILGGMCLIDYFTIDELKDKIETQIKRYFVEGPDVTKLDKTLERTIYLHDKVTLVECESQIKYIIEIKLEHLNAFLEKKVNDIVEYRGKQFKIINIQKNKVY
ncbi:MAG: DUF6339 family protein [Erysipelotrichaceae bacterium]|nr:DUF6339 family protein [Erysipelotrichaceae bacterium]